VVTFLGITLAVVSAALSPDALGQLTSRWPRRYLRAALTLAMLFALVVIGLVTANLWMVVVGAVECALLAAVGSLAWWTQPAPRPATIAELGSVLADFASAPGSRSLQLCALQDGTVTVGRRFAGGGILRYSRYALVEDRCRHCVIEQQIQSIAEEPAAAGAVEIYRQGTSKNRMMEAYLSRRADTPGWKATADRIAGLTFDYRRCSVHRPGEDG